MRTADVQAILSYQTWALNRFCLCDYVCCSMEQGKQNLEIAFLVPQPQPLSLQLKHCPLKVRGNQLIDIY